MALYKRLWKSLPKLKKRKGVLRIMVRSTPTNNSLPFSIGKMSARESSKICSRLQGIDWERAGIL